MSLRPFAALFVAFVFHFLPCFEFCNDPFIEKQEDGLSLQVGQKLA